MAGLAPRRRQQAAILDPHPKWLLFGFAVTVLGVGIGTDLRPDLGTPLFYVFAASVLLLTLLPRWRRPGSSRGYPRSAARSAGRLVLTLVLSRIVMIMLVLGYVVARVVLRGWDVPMPATASSVLIVVSMPIWRRALIRKPRATHRG